ncbi:hypothetical protein [Paenibacillus oleatilyticus]|uniref:hypothetical protein n=1 Tax=Paenibacillus oleatilyticus TaxID=2594886 RepID=UPI001C1FB5C8|nr:hypothetical protein [Paenibacillus oleatilyticus]MBU7319950.1 hypothetical protein [Paenibacillus oleatilyticus]
MDTLKNPLLQTTGNPSSRVGRWPSWIGYAAAAWSLVYGLLGLYWALGGSGFPFGEGDSQPNMSFLGGLQAKSGAPWIAVLGFVGAILAAAMTRLPGKGILRVAVLAFACAASAILLIAIPDARVIMAVGYAPICLVGAPFGWPPVNYLEKALPWEVINQFICMAGGFLWVGTALAYYRRSRQACGSCGRTGSAAASGWTTPEAAACWGRWAVYVAFILPFGYAGMRWAWAFGIPLGIDRELLQELHTNGLWLAGAGLATVAAGGSVLTLGLIQRWGEIFPRWTLGLSGKRVPPALAIVPASFITVVVMTGGLTVIRMNWSAFLSGAFITNPMMWWPVWGISLGAATLAYYYRRRGQCTVCGLE